MIKTYTYANHFDTNNLGRIQLHSDRDGITIHHNYPYVTIHIMYGRICVPVVFRTFFYARTPANDLQYFYHRDVPIERPLLHKPFMCHGICSREDGFVC